MKVAEIRQKFFDYFRSKDHKIVPSAPIVVKDDPTLMFTNAGMNQFKDIFLENEEATYPRVADTQKCLRVSGKHNDLEQVGHDTYHHTMFEMLGNWSFGDYFKEEAIQYAWELLTREYGLNPERLYVTVFEGDQNLEEDTEAYHLWKAWVPEDRILKFGKDENFWEMGDAGPCGPSSEIHYDFRHEAERKKQDAGELVNQDHPEVIELWNLVFIEFNRYQDGTLEPLPKKHIDTGMGLERLTAVLQNKDSNYDTDIFQPLIQYICDKFKVKYGQKEETDIALRVVADHSRAITFTICDGQLPANTGAGYVIRRILRRGVRYGFQYLGAESPFLFELVEVLVNQFGEVFPEVKAQKDFVQKVVQEEEQSFLRTLSVGTKLFEQKVQKMENDTIPGDFAFELYDTYGFPLDLTRIMAREKGLTVDEEGFRKGLEQQKARSKKASQVSTGDWHIVREGENTTFVGYDHLHTHVNILRYREVKTKKETLYHLVLDRTPFYPESGGQVGDTGKLFNDEESITVKDTQKAHNLIIHITDKVPQNLENTFQAEVDRVKRALTERNHTATHLMHAALKEVLGSHVDQKGSLVNEAHLRFDFSHFSKVEPEAIRKVENRVNQKIRENIPRQEERSVPVQEALNSGATALFGEKYGEYVRVITFDDQFSKELCGGTHVPYTGSLGFFKITNETSVAAGIRRIEAVTGAEAEKYVNEKIDTLTSVQKLLKNPSKPVASVQDLIEHNKELNKQIEEYQKAKIKSLREKLLQEAEKVNGQNRLIAQEVNIDSPDAGKDLAFDLKNNDPEAIILLGAGFDEKANIWLIIPENLAKQKELDASELIKTIASEINGGGGGKPFFATAGGKNPEKVTSAIKKGKELLKDQLG